jgi:predicted nuclease of predicted toxin-antitoxin system
MRILLDECLPRKLKDRLVGHECATVPKIGLAGKKNGELLTLAEGRGFEVLLTMDRGLEHTQSLTGRRIAIVILCARSNKLKDLLPLVDDCLERMHTIAAGQIARVGE